ncbi:MAG: acetyl-CoA carboxylase biotin carboxyl carrier protein [bacterium]
MDIKKINKIIKIMEEKNITEFSLEEEGIKIFLKRGGNIAYEEIPIIKKPSLMETVVSQGEKKEEIKSTEEDYLTVASPMVGTFYRAPSPDSPSYVNVGTIVEIGQMLCIIEAMKLMNEVKSEYRGKVAKILVENGTPIEYGENLFLFEKI